MEIAYSFYACIAPRNDNKSKKSTRVLELAALEGDSISNGESLFCTSLSDTNIR